MDAFKTPAEAIAALKTECDLSWEEYCLDNNILEQDHPPAYQIASKMYKKGFAKGAMYVTSYLVGLMPSPVVGAAVKEFTSVPAPESKTISEIDEELRKSKE